MMYLLMYPMMNLLNSASGITRNAIKSWVLGKKPLRKMPPPPLPEKSPLIKLFVNFFLSLIFIFMKIFVCKLNLFSFNLFF